MTKTMHLRRLYKTLVYAQMNLWNNIKESALATKYSPILLLNTV